MLRGDYTRKLWQQGGHWSETFRCGLALSLEDAADAPLPTGALVIYAGYFTEDPPGRSCVQVSALPAGAHVEIEATAAI